MYSNSNSFLGANNSLRPGSQHQYGTPFGQQYPQQPAQQPGAFAPQPTGYAQPPLTQQHTAMPGSQAMPQQQQPLQGLQPQYTGFPGQAPQQQGFQGATPPVPQIPQQFQQQYNQLQHQQPQSSFLSPSNAPPAATTTSTPSIKPQPTGFSAMAASFRDSATSERNPHAPTSSKISKRIPTSRLSFITAQDQAKFETLFKSAVGDSNATMSGEKARDLLLRSRLDGDSLSHIWTLSDTTRSGALHFPEFALAMYLCNLKLIGKPLPGSLPEYIKNEVSSMVDIINFSITDESEATSGGATNAPSFTPQNPTLPTIQHPQPQPSNSQILQAQMTGFPGAQMGMQPQQTGFPGGMTNPQPTGYNGPRPPMPPMPTGFAGGLAPVPAAPLNAQPTGQPGQWGLVNTPASGLPNIDALQARMMPQAGREQQSYTTAGLSGNAVIPWAITKDEKTRYDQLFRAWDGLGKGFIGGDQAIEIMGQSGLDKTDLERIWTLSDNGNKGRLDLDEFAVAMHLIYRKLNGYPIPNTLPPELVPPSTRKITESLGTIRSMLNQESDFRKSSGAALLPQKTGVSYMKSHSFKGGNPSLNAGRKDGTVFRNNDDDVGYKSSARRRIGNASPRPNSPAPVASSEELSLDQLRKKIREKQVLLDALDFKDEAAAEEDDILDRRDRRDAEELYRRIRRIQDDIDAHPDAAFVSGDSEAERRALKRQLQNLTDKIPELASQVRKNEKAIADAKLELFRLRDAKAHPGSASTIIGTGPGGSVTESDRLKARAKAMMQQRTAALTGKKVDVSGDDLDAPKRLEEENIKARTEKENNERMVRDVEDSVREFARGIEDNLKENGQTSANEHEKRRWEDALGVEDEVRDFIFDLQRSSRAARIRTQDRKGGRAATTEPVRAEAPPRRESPAAAGRTDATPPAQPSSSNVASYSAYKTPEERAAFIKQQAEQRMAERLAALGIKAPSKPGETAAQRIERERAERAAKLRQAEEEDARREAERQARIAEEQGVPPPAPKVENKKPPPAPKVENKKPPPPPARKGAKNEDSAKRAGEEEAAARKAEEERLAEEQRKQQLATKQMEDEAKLQEDELAKERDASSARLKALEEQVRQGKLKKEEEKKRKKAALAEAKAKEAKLAAQRAEIEAARQKELELQRQLEAMNEDSSSDDDNGPEQITPQASTPTHGGSQLDSQELERKSSPAPVPAPPVAPPPVISPPVVSPPPVTVSSPSAEVESRNPYFRMMSQAESSATPSASAPSVPASASPSQPKPSTNPFLQITQTASTVPLGPQLTGNVSRKRPDTDDEWGSGDEESDDESDDDRPAAGAAHLASLLFGSMGPPRPLSAAGDKSRGASPTAQSAPFSPPPNTSLTEALNTPVPPPLPEAHPSAPPPPPPMPGGVAPSAFPPPPPPIMGMAPPPPPPPPAAGDLPAPPPGGRPAGFLGEIQLGKTLRKTETKDRSASALQGRVLG
ncbi:hypothetical protein F4861DRAFT_226026 [Xylaria intraflava]|nr:hypothetical protein F4861DRAFT_226026 [Xylaria intraflava]